MNPPSAVLGGVHGKVCWLIAYMEHMYSILCIIISVRGQALRGCFKIDYLYTDSVRKEWENTEQAKQTLTVTIHIPTIKQHLN